MRKIKTKNESNNFDEKITKDDFGINSSLQESIKKLMELINQDNNKEDSNDDIKTGFGKLSLKQGELNIIASKSDYLTTAFELSMIYHISIKSKTKAGLFISGNYNNVEITARLLSMISSISDSRICSGLLKKEELKKFEDATHDLSKAPIYIFNNPNISFERLESIITDYVNDNNIRIAFIEGFEFVEDLVDSKERDYRENLFSVLYKLKQLAEKLQITIVIGMTLPKKENEEINSFPSIRDFKRYMIIPECADRIFFIHIDGYVIGQKNQTATLMVTKRNGIRAPCYDLKFITNTGLFVNDEDGGTNS